MSAKKSFSFKKKKEKRMKKLLGIEFESFHLIFPLSFTGLALTRRGEHYWTPFLSWSYNHLKKKEKQLQLQVGWH